MAEENGWGAESLGESDGYSDSSAEGDDYAEVLEALAEDARHRVVGVTGGLYSLSDLGPLRPLRGVAQVVMEERYVDEYRTTFEPTGIRLAPRAGSDAEFARRLGTVYPRLAGFDLAANGLVLAGGSVTALIHGYRDAAPRWDQYAAELYSDFDLFLVGHPDERSVLAMLDRLAEALDAMTVFRTQSSVTFFSAGYPPVQVILRHYSHVAEVLHGFDLGACAFAWDGARVFTTRMGRFASERGANILNLASHRRSYESRVKRYMRRGWALALPEIDPERVPELLTIRGALPWLRPEFPAEIYDEHTLCLKSGSGAPPGTDPDDNSAPESAEPGYFSYHDYFDFQQSIDYYNPIERTLVNFSAGHRLLAGDALGAGLLCASEGWAPGLDLASMVPFNATTFEIARELFNQEEYSDPSERSLHRLRMLATPEMARRALDHYIKHGRFPPLLEEFESMFERLAALRIPFVVRPVTDGTNLVSLRSATAMGPREWYGPGVPFRA